jgi:8-oxo-dGTP diphosphatase
MKNHELPPKAAIWAAGGAVYRLGSGGKPEYLLIHRPRYDDWSLPKGKLDRKETFGEAARREVREETGSKAELGLNIGTISYETNAGNQKVVRYWLLEHAGGTFTANREVDSIEWFRRGNAIDMLTYERDRKLLARAHELVKQPTSSRIYLVRHGDAGERSTWKGNGDYRPLIKLGRKQSSAIHDLLIEGPITAISSSRALRCRQTVAGLGKTLGLRVQEETALAEATPPETLIKRIAKLAGTTMVMSSHGDVIAGVIGQLAAEGTAVDGPLESKPGSIWALEATGGRITSAGYIPPLV